MNDEALKLARRGRSLTRQRATAMKHHAALTRERAQVWKQAVEAGASQRQLALMAGIDPCQVAKAIERYASNGDA